MIVSDGGLAGGCNEKHRWGRGGGWKEAKSGMQMLMKQDKFWTG